MALIVNLFGGPGVGKSKFAADIYSELKWKNISCETIPEYSKRKVFENSLGVLDDQVYVFAKQLHAINTVMDKVDVLVVDSPLFLSIYYGRYFAKNNSIAFESLVIEAFNEMNNLNYFLGRRKDDYDPIGRYQTEEKAKEIDGDIYNLLDEFNIKFQGYSAEKKFVNVMVNEIFQKLKD